MDLRMKIYCAVDRNAFKKTVERFSKSFFVEVVSKKTNSIHFRYGGDKEFDVLVLHSQNYRNKNLRGKTIDVLVQTAPGNRKMVTWALINFPNIMVQTL